MRLVYLPEAREDRLEAVRYYHSCEEGLAADFYQEFERAENDLKEWPELGNRRGWMPPQAHHPLPLWNHILIAHILIARRFA